jgi:hypothetical protein
MVPRGDADLHRRLARIIDDWGAPIGGQRIVNYDDRDFRYSRDVPTADPYFSGRNARLQPMNRQLAAPARARMPKKSPAWAIHCAQNECLTMTRRQFARGNGTTRMSGFSCALSRQYPAPHNKATYRTFERLLLPTNGATAAFAAGSPRAARHGK